MRKGGNKGMISTKENPLSAHIIKKAPAKTIATSSVNGPTRMLKRTARMFILY